MPGQQLIKLAEKYNPFLAEFVREHNEEHPLETSLHIHDLTNPATVRCLNTKGYNITAVPLVGGLENPHHLVSDWVNKNLREGSISYKRSVTEPIKDSKELTQLIKAEVVQRGICVVGRNDSDHEFEVHRYGNEGLIPWFFNGITLITKGFDYDTKTIDKSTAVLIYMPANKNLVYILNNENGHYAPHILAVMEVLLPNRTNDAELIEYENIFNKKGIVYTARNKILASDRGTNGTIAKVVRETETTDVIKDLQKLVDRNFRPGLIKLLS